MQTVDTPNGMNFHAYYVPLVCRNDLTSVRWFDINGKLARLQKTATTSTLCMGGDDNHVRARHYNSPNTGRQI